MPLPSVRRFYNEDYPGAPSYFQKLVSALNLFSDPVYQLLNRGIVPGINTNEQFYTFTIVGGVTPDVNRASFVSTISGKPRAVYPVQCYPTAAITTPMADPVFISWYPNGSQIVITGITGLIENVQYTITLRVA